MNNLFNYNKKDINGEFEEFQFPKGNIKIDNPEEYHRKFKQDALTKTEKNKYYMYLLANIEKGAQEKADEVYKTLISNCFRKKDKEDIVFVGLYSSYLECRRTKYNKEGKVRKGYEELKVPTLRIYKDFIAGLAKGLYVDGSKTISIASDMSHIKQAISALEYIYLVSHETRHYIQEYEMEHGILNSSSLAYVVDDKNFRNYHFRTVELNAEEHGCRAIIDIFKKYLLQFFIEEDIQRTGERHEEDYYLNLYVPFIDKYIIRLKMLSENKSIAFAFAKGLNLTDVSDIGFILSGSKELIKNQDGDKLKELYDKLIKMGAIPKIFVITSEYKLVLQSEDKLLKGYFDAKGEEKEVYEKALKYCYTYKGTDKSEFVMEDSYYKISNLKICFIEEQLAKEREYIERIKHIKKETLLSENNIYGSTIWVFILEIINIRLKRIKYYYLITSTTNTMLNSEAKALYDNFKEICLSLYLELIERKEIGNSYFSETINYDYSNKITK